jgi:hypothetical protein
VKARGFEILSGVLVGLLVAAAGPGVADRFFGDDDSAAALTVRTPGVSYRATSTDVPVGGTVRIELAIPAGPLYAAPLDDPTATSPQSTAQVRFDLPDELDVIEGTAQLVDAVSGVPHADIDTDELTGASGAPTTILEADFDRILSVDATPDPDRGQTDESVRVAAVGIGNPDPVQVVIEPADLVLEPPLEDTITSTPQDIDWTGSDHQMPTFLDVTRRTLVDVRPVAYPEQSDDGRWYNGGLIFYPGDRFTVRLRVANLADPEGNNDEYLDGPSVARDVQANLLVPTGQRAEQHTITGSLFADNASHPPQGGGRQWVASSVDIDVVGGGVLDAATPTYTTGDEWNGLRFDPAAMIHTRLVGRPWADAQRPERPAGEPGPDISAFGDTSYLPGGDGYSLFSTVTVADPAAAERD